MAKFYFFFSCNFFKFLQIFHHFGSLFNMYLFHFLKGCYLFSNISLFYWKFPSFSLIWQQINSSIFLEPEYDSCFLRANKMFIYMLVMHPCLVDFIVSLKKNAEKVGRASGHTCSRTLTAVDICIHSVLSMSLSGQLSRAAFKSCLQSQYCPSSSLPPPPCLLVPFFGHRWVQGIWAGILTFVPPFEWKKREMAHNCCSFGLWRIDMGLLCH